MIYLMRHGLDDENFIGGWSNVSLTDEGIEEVIDALANMIYKEIVISNIISSDVKRAKQTASIINNHYNVDLSIDPRFNEQNKGLLNGMLKLDAEKLYPKYFKDVNINTVYPNGESLQDLYIRIEKLLKYIYELDDNTLIITHRGVINMIYYILNKISLDMDKNKFGVTHASVHELDVYKKTIRRVI